MKTVLFTARGWLYAHAGATFFAAALPARAQLVPNPILFVTQVPVRETANTVTSVGGNHLATTAAAPRGGDLMIRYPHGALKNLTRLAYCGEAETEQGGSSIAVRDPCIHWSEGALGATLDPAADTDDDGASNFEEYATGSSPVAQPPAGQRNHLLEATRQTIIGIGGKEVNVLTFRRSTTAYRLETTVESSDDMTSWTEAAHFDSTSRRSAPDFAVGVTSSDTPNVEVIHLVDLRPTTASRRFYRLRLEAP